MKNSFVFASYPQCIHQRFKFLFTNIVTGTCMIRSISYVAMFRIFGNMLYRVRRVKKDFCKIM